MGITIVQKSDLQVPRPWAKKALVLAGGAMTGASFKAGGLKSLNDYFANYRITDFDLFVGISSGSLVAAPLAAGMSPEELLRILDGSSSHYSVFAPWHFYFPNIKEVIVRPITFAYERLIHIPRAVRGMIGNWQMYGPRVVHAVWRLLREPTGAHYEATVNLVTAMLTMRAGPDWLQMLPTGIFDNSPIERYLRRNIERNHLTNSFQVTERVRGKKLYICAMMLDGARRVVFGPDERSDVTISEAVQASTALPIFYKPARIKGVDYVDGSVFETAPIDVAVNKGAELIVCYNPFRPIENEVVLEYIRKQNRYVTKGRPLAASGFLPVLNQIFRSVFHSRLRISLEQLRQDPKFTGDIILIEPSTSDMAFFELNPLIYSNRVKAAKLGFESVRNSIEEHFDEVARILAAYGITMTRTSVEADAKRLREAGKDAGRWQAVLEGRNQAAKRRSATSPTRARRTRT
ncbi:MAG: patatin-like phospholipase family protein [Deltaproteobacteria bacterium]|nr:patatin-like phospholipase family protein [Deltaproteobacteria bacterium]